MEHQIQTVLAMYMEELSEQMVHQIQTMEHLPQFDQVHINASLLVHTIGVQDEEIKEPLQPY